MTDTQTYERTTIYSDTIIHSLKDWWGIEDWQSAYNKTFSPQISGSISERERVIKVIRQAIDTLKALDDYCGTARGVLLIPENKFDEYARELVEELYDLKSIPYFILDNVDWKGVTSDIKSDYSECEWNGHTYYYR
jgi:hypothetical protein